MNPSASDVETLIPAVAQLIVTALNLEMSPEEIVPDEPLFGDAGLGLDSIDILEISLAVSRQYGIQLRSDNADNVRIFASLRNLCDYIASQPQA